MQLAERAGAVRDQLHDGVFAVLAAVSLLSPIVEEALRRAAQHSLALPAGLRRGEWLAEPRGHRGDPDRDPARIPVTRWTTSCSGGALRDETSHFLLRATGQRPSLPPQQATVQHLISWGDRPSA